MNHLIAFNFTRYIYSIAVPGDDSHHGGGSALDMDQDQNRTELTKLEIELCKQNFGFYDSKKVGSVERFELPMLLNSNDFASNYSLACGYYLDDKRLAQLN
jgi:hypothetical protein